MFIRDLADALSRATTPDGALRLRARIARAGLHDYKAGEINAPGAPDAVVRVYRPPEEVFDPASMASFAGVPVTLDHPPAMVDAANRARYAVGEAGSTPTREGDHLVSDLLLTDAVAIARAEAGADLSNGYRADFVFERGTTPAGEHYDARQRNIRGNHVALVDQGRCGPTCRIDPATADAVPGNCACPPAPDRAHERGADMGRTDTRRTADTRRIVLDGVAIDTTEAGAAAIERLEAALAAARATGSAVAVPDAETLDALVTERAATIAAARDLLGAGFDDRHRGTAAIRRAAVAKVLGDAAIRARGDDYVAAAFDALVAARQPGNPLAAQFAAAPATLPGGALAARNRFLTHAWKGDHPSPGAP